MNRITKATSELLRFATLPARIVFGIVKAVQKEMPERIQFPYELRKKQPTKENENGNDRNETIVGR
jgi:hypothetical protein